MGKSIVFNETHAELPEFLIGELKGKRYMLDASAVF